MESLALIAKGIVFGLGAAIPIGPVNVEIARRALTRSFGAGMALGLGAVTIDTSYVILATVGVAPLLDQPLVEWPLTVCGIAMLLYLGISSLIASRKAANSPLPAIGTPAGNDPDTTSHTRSYVTGLLMTALNPITIAFWFVVFPAYASTITQRPKHDLPMICIGVFIGTAGWVVFFAGLMSVAGRWRKAWWLVFADLIGGMTLLAFAAIAVWRSVRRLL